MQVVLVGCDDSELDWQEKECYEHGGRRITLRTDRDNIER
jgi:hypothetical protein